MTSRLSLHQKEWDRHPMPQQPDGADGIWTTEAFLGRCHPDIRSIFDYWNGRRRGRRMPARGDFDPLLETPRLLPTLSLVDAHRPPFRPTSRLVGTTEVQNVGCAP